ncbi:MAG: hypothetical protein HY644_00475 [Acidobacteria bacterium]|nr:hypothetical protein [Acidobacteriota bacterium]
MSGRPLGFGGQFCYERGQVFASEFPVEGAGSLLVALLKTKQAMFNIGQGVEVVGRKYLALDDGKVDFNLIEPTGMNGCMDGNNVGPSSLSRCRRPKKLDQPSDKAVATSPDLRGVWMRAAMTSFSSPWAANKIILARMTSLYGDVYFLALDSGSARSSEDSLMTYGLFLGSLSHFLRGSLADHAGNGQINTSSYL